MIRWSDPPQQQDPILRRRSSPRNWAKGRSFQQPHQSFYDIPFFATRVPRLAYEMLQPSYHFAKDQEVSPSAKSSPSGYASCALTAPFTTVNILFGARSVALSSSYSPEPKELIEEEYGILAAVMSIAIRTLSREPGAAPQVNKTFMPMCRQDH